MTKSASTHPPKDPPGRKDWQDSGMLARFESGLAPRTKVSSARCKEYFGWSADKIQREAETVAEFVHRFAVAVVDAIDEPARADQFLRNLDLKAIARDHDWRTIFRSIRNQEAIRGGYQRAVLVKYLQYLSSRKRLLNYILTKKRGLLNTAEVPELEIFQNPGDSIHGEAGHGQPSRNTGQPHESEFVRLALGENVELKLEETESVDIRLANHSFRLLGGQPPCLIDENGVMFFLRPGRNTIGRHPETDVPINPDFGNVSRAHLIIEWEPDSTLRLIDLSSRGTFLPRQILDAVKPMDA